MKFLPRLAHLSLLALSLASISCATPANRRALYFSTKPNGPWTDYERRREAEAATGVVSSSSKPVAAPAGPVAPLPKGAGSAGALTPTTAAPGDVTPPAATPPEVAPAGDGASAPITEPPPSGN